MRKSPGQRISDTAAAITQWEAAGLGTDPRVAFMRGARARLEGGKGLSPKQREWLDSLCALGPPQPKCDPALLARLDAALEHLTPYQASILRDFRARLHSGYTLTPKQEAYMESLLVEGERIAREGKWQPSEEMRAEGLFAAQVVNSRSNTWKASHPGTVKAAMQVLEGTGDEWSYTKLIDSLGPAVREFRNPKFSPGDLVTITDYQYPRPGLTIDPDTVGVVVSGPEVGQSPRWRLSYTVLLHGEPRRLDMKLLKRTRG